MVEFEKVRGLIDCPLSIYTVYDHPVFSVEHLTKVRGRVGTTGYCKEFGAFDIEVTTVDEETAFMYVWQFCYNYEFVVVGRTWEEYLLLIEQLETVIPEDDKFIIFVHNLSYEFQFLRGLFTFPADDVLVLKSRKILKATNGKIEYRCSWMLSNLSLYNWGKSLKASTLKMSGDEFDYNKRRYPWTELTIEEWSYCVTDVVTLAECVIKQMEIENDSFYSLPYTSTGYVRRDIKKELYRIRKSLLEPMYPDIELMRKLHEAFRGGNTHANRWYAGDILSNVYSDDIQSSYPYCMCNDLFPMSPFEKVSCDLLTFKESIKKNTHALLCMVDLERVELKNRWWGFPYIPVHKCKMYSNVQRDNGRVLSAESLTIALTDIDFRIINEEYNFKLVNVRYLYRSRYGRLPRSFVRVIEKYFERKTALKGVEGQEVFYDFSKRKLNSGYGMLAEYSLKPYYRYEHGEYIKRSFDIARFEKMFFPYQWGVWVTAHARNHLESGLKLAGESAVYCDTDSVKGLDKLDFTEYNDIVKENCLVNDSYAIDQFGNTQYMGMYEPDAHYLRFITLGAKKYVVEKLNKKTGEKEIEITISGVGKMKGAKELEENGGLESFGAGLKFVKAGGTACWYNDGSTKRVFIDGGWLTLTPSIAALPSEYTVGLSDDYETLLSDIELLKKEWLDT